MDLVLVLINANNPDLNLYSWSDICQSYDHISISQSNI